ncbi:MAG: cobalt-precorrin 5A hydrolase [Lachnospiraceae bacterium]
MKLAIISFTKQGGALCGKLTRRFRELGYDCNGYVQSRLLNEFQEYPGLCPVRESLSEWTGKRFDETDGLVFVGAAGIAVRAIAPFVTDKKKDPAVVAIDDCGRFAVSLLSGHMGGANELARVAAAIIGAEPVITTATDINGKTAIDVWASQRDLQWPDRGVAKQISAALLEGQAVGFYSDYPLADPVPEDFVKGQLSRYQVWITANKKPESRHMISWFSDEDTTILRLIPRSLSVGIGCRRGTAAAVLRRQLEQVLADHNLDLLAVGQIASIDLKRDEAGIITLADQLKVPFLFYQPEVLQQVPGIFSSSEFVKRVTGTDNVCERAAMAGAGENGTLIVKKQAGAGVTIAVAQQRLEIKRNDI